MGTAFRSDLTVKVSLLGGATIVGVCEQMVDLAQKLDVWVEASFNDVKLLACPTTNRKGLAEAYFVQIEKKDGYRLATAH